MKGNTNIEDLKSVKDISTLVFRQTANISANGTATVTFPTETLPDGYSYSGFFSARALSSYVIPTALDTTGQSGDSYTPKHAFYNLDSTSKTNLQFIFTMFIYKK